MRMCVWILAAVAALGGGFVFAGPVTPVGPFVAQGEGFETSPGGFPSELSVFGGDAVWRSPTGFVHTTTGWTFISTINPNSGSRLAGSNRVSEFVFDDPVSKFGGYFGSNSDASDGTVRFYDMNDVLIDTEVINAPNGGSWTWNGWMATDGMYFKRVEIEGNYTSGGFVQMDDLQIIATPEPGTIALFGLALLGFGFARRRRRA